MATVVTPKNWVAGTDYTTATNLNTGRDVAMQLQGSAPTGGQGALDFFRAVQGTAQTGLAISTYVSITFATGDELLDAAGGHGATNPSRYVGQTPGWYEVSGIVSFASNSSGRRYAQLALNGSPINGTQVSCPAMSSGATDIAIPTTFVQMNGSTDYVEIQGFSDQASWGTNVATGSSALTVRWVHV